MYYSTKRYAYRVDLNIDVAITSYSTRIAGFLFVVLVALFGGGKGPGCGFKFAGSRSRVPVRVRRSKPYGNLGVKLYDYDTFTRPPKYKYLCLYSLEYGTPVRYGSTRIYYSYGTVPALFTIRFGRAETVPYLYSYEHGEYCLKYSTVRVQYSAVQSRTRTSTSKRGA